TIRVWDAATGEAVGEPFRGHTGLVLSVAFSSDGRHIASGSDDETIRLWDVGAGATMAGCGTLLSTAADPSPHIVHPLDTDDPATVDFTDPSVIDEDGWISDDGKLLMWVPQAHR
ncbi:hypothetical protein BC834DRAFT_785490, partial [Gloeopeniophorella convolvens]